MGGVEMAYTYSRWQRMAIVWLSFFSVVCVVNSILVIRFGIWNFDGDSFAYVLPFAHTVVVVVTAMARTTWMFGRGTLGRDPDSLYIRENYPEIWRKLHPLGGNSWNGVAANRFLRFKYDDGADERLNDIRIRLNINGYLLCWPFFITMGVWLLNVFLMLTDGS